MALPDSSVIRSYPGGAAPTYLVATVASGYVSNQTLTVANTTGWYEVSPYGYNTTNPLGTSGPYTLVVDYGLGSEEKILCASGAIALGLNTVINIYNVSGTNGRGYDGTLAQPHAAGFPDNFNVFPVSTAIEQAQFNYITADAVISGSVAGGDLVGSYPNPTLPPVSTSGTYGNNASSLTLTLDNKGRVIDTYVNEIEIAESQVTNLTTNLITISGNQTTMSGQIATISGKQVTDEDAITNLGIGLGIANDNIDLLNQNSVVLSGYVSTISGNQATDEDNIAVLSGQIIATNTKVATLSGNLTTLTNNFTTLSGQFVTLSGNQSIDESNIAALSGQVVIISGTLSGVVNNQITDEVNIATLSGQMVTANSNIATISGNQATDEDNIATLSGQMVTANSNIATNSGQIVTNSSNISTLSGQMVTANSNIATISGKQVTDESNFVTLSGQVANQGNSIGVISGKQVTDETNISTLSGQMVTANSNIATNSGNIVTLSGSLDITNNNIVSLSGRQAADAVNITALQNGTSTLSGYVATISGKQVTDEGNIATLSGLQITDASNIATISGKQAIDEANIATISGKQVTDESNIATISGNFVTLSGQYATTSGVVNTISGKQVTDEVNIATISGQVVTITNNVATISGNQITDESNIATLSGQMVTANTNIATNSGNISTLSGYWYTTNQNLILLEGDVSTDEANIATISGQVVTNTSNIASLSGSLATLSGQYVTTSGLVTDQSGYIATISGNQVTDEANIATISGNFTTLSGQYATTSGVVNTISGKQVTDEANISTVSGVAATNTINIATLSGQMVTANSNIATNSGNIVSLSGQFATTSGRTIFSGTNATGDLSGTYPGPTVAKIQGISISPTAPTNNQVLRYSTTSGTWYAGTGNALFPTTTKSGNYTAVPNDYVVCNATAGAMTVTLTNAPANGSVIAVASQTTSTYDVTIVASGSDNIAGDGSFVLAGNGVFNSVEFYYDSVRTEWLISSNNFGDTAGGDLTGTYPNPTVSYLNGTPVSSTPPNTGQVLASVGGVWTPITSSGVGTPGPGGANGYYGAFYDTTTTQTATSTTSGNVVAIGSTFTANGITRSASGTITFGYTGTYLVAYTVQLFTSSNASRNVDIWFRKNGVNVPNTNATFAVPNGPAGSAVTAAVTHIITASGNDNFQIMWMPTNTDTTIKTIASGANYPTAPGVFVSVSQIMYNQTGTYTVNAVAASGTNAATATPLTLSTYAPVTGATASGNTASGTGVILPTPTYNGQWMQIHNEDLTSWLLVYPQPTAYIDNGSTGAPIWLPPTSYWEGVATTTLSWDTAIQPLTSNSLAVNYLVAPGQTDIELQTYGTPGTYGTTSGIPVITTDTYGRSTVTVTGVQINQSQVTGLSGNLSALSGSITTTNSNLATLSGQYVTTSGIVTTNTSNIATLSGQMVTANANIASTSGSLVTLSGQYVTTSGVVNTISGKQVTDENNIATLSGNLVTLSGSLNTTNSNLASLSGQYATLSGQYATTSGVVNTISGKQVIDETNIATLSGQMVTANSNIATLSGQMITANNNIATNSGSIVTTNSNVSTISGKQITDESNIATLSGQMVTANSNIATLSGQMVTANTNIATVSGVAAAALPKAGGTMSGAIAMGSNKITGLANGSAASDAAAFGQIPTALPPNGTAGGDLTGSYPNPTLSGVGTAGTYGSATLVPVITTDSKGRVTGVTTSAPLDSTKLPLAGGSLTGPLYSNSSVTVTGNVTVTGILSVPYTVSASSGTNTPPINNGSLNYSDVNIMAGFSSNVGNYNQMVMQNTNSGTTSSTNFNVSNNLATASSYYGEFGMNSSNYAGTGGFNIPNAVYVGAANGDVTLGTYTANSIHFVNNNSSNDSMTITSAGLVVAASGLTVTGTLSASVGGDLTGTLPNPTVAKIQGVAISNTAPASGSVLTYNGTQWAPVNDIEYYGLVDLTTQSAAIGTTLIYSTPTAQLYNLNFYGKVTTAATTSSTLGPVSVIFTDPDGTTITLTDDSTSANTTSSAVYGSFQFYAKSGTNISYSVAYASSGATAMQYNLHMKLT